MWLKGKAIAEERIGRRGGVFFLVSIIVKQGLKDRNFSSLNQILEILDREVRSTSNQKVAEQHLAKQGLKVDQDWRHASQVAEQHLLNKD